MARGVPKAGFRNTKKRQMMGSVPRVSKPVLPEVPEIFETDEEIREKLETRFAVIKMMSEACTLGQIKALVISGAPGLGKSFTVMQALEEYDPEEKKTVVKKGFTRATGLYKTLYELQVQDTGAI